MMIENTKLADKKESASGGRLTAYLVKYFKLWPPLVLLALLAAGYFFMLKPKYDRVRTDIAGLITERTEEMTVYEDYFTQLNRIKRDFDKVSAADLARLEGALPDEPAAEELMSGLEALFLSSGAIVNSISTSPGGEVDPALAQAGIMAVSAEVSLSGVDYDKLMHVLAALERHARLVDIKQINFAAGGKDVSMTLAAYYLAGTP